MNHTMEGRDPDSDQKWIRNRKRAPQHPLGNVVFNGKELDRPGGSHSEEKGADTQSGLNEDAVENGPSVLGDEEKDFRTSSQSPSPKLSGLRGSGFSRVFPYFLSALLFLASVFSVVAPLPFTFFMAWLLVFAPFPLLIETMMRAPHFRGLLGVCLSNLILVGTLGGGGASLGFISFVLLPAVLLPFCLLKKSWSPERSIAATVLAMTGTVGVAFLGYCVIKGASPLVVINSQLEIFMAEIQKLVPPESLQESEFNLERLQQGAVDLPGALVIFSLIQVVVNFSLLVRIRIGFTERLSTLSKDFLLAWKTPEWLVWPTLFFGGVLVFFNSSQNPWVHGACSNLFKVIMALYFLQGLSIMGAFFKRWKLEGFLRPLLYVFLFIVFPILVLGIGFFDLWFDFRSKLRQSS